MENKIYARNREAEYNYFIEDKYEAGMVLAGIEAKSIVMGKANLRGSYITIRNESFDESKTGKTGFPLWILMKIFGVNPANRTIDEKLNFLIEYKDKIFDEKFQYKKIYEEIEESIKNKKE